MKFWENVRKFYLACILSISNQTNLDLNFISICENINDLNLFIFDDNIIIKNSVKISDNEDSIIKQQITDVKIVNMKRKNDSSDKKYKSKINNRYNENLSDDKEVKIQEKNDNNSIIINNEIIIEKSSFIEQENSISRPTVSSINNQINNFNINFNIIDKNESNNSKNIIGDEVKTLENSSIEKSMEELEYYLNYVGINIKTEDYKKEFSLEKIKSYFDKSFLGKLFKSKIDENKDNTVSFRPKNLPKKSEQEELYHIWLVEENKRIYQEKIENKKIDEDKRKKVLEIKKNKQEELRLYWCNEIIPNWHNLKLNKDSIKNYFYKGIPPLVRGNVWLLCIGNNFCITKEYYEIEVKKAIDMLIISNENNYKFDDEVLNCTNIEDIEYEKYNIKKINKESSIRQIDLDVERTFSNIGLFKQGSPLAEDLREILRAFVASRPDIGYIQGLSYIGGMLLVHMDKYQAFVALLNLVLNPNIIAFYRFDECQIKRRFQIFKQVFYHNLSELCDYFESIDLLPEYYIVDWIMTLFSRNLNIDLTARIWDVFMINGIKAIFQAAIVLLSHFEKKILENDLEFDYILKELKSLNEVIFDEDELMDSMKAVTFPEWIEEELEKLNDEYIPIK